MDSNHCTPGQAPESFFIELLTRATLCALRKEGLSATTYVVIRALHLLTLPSRSYKPTEDLVKNADVDLGGLRWGLRACFPDKVPGEATAAGVWTVSRVSRLWSRMGQAGDGARGVHARRYAGKGGDHPLDEACPAYRPVKVSIKVMVLSQRNISAS